MQVASFGVRGREGGRGGEGLDGPKLVSLKAGQT